jgi:hypothetical protein
MGSSGGGGGPSSTTQTTTTQLPAYAQPYAQDLLKKGAALSEQPYTPYTGQRLAEMSPEQQLGLTMTGNRAINGSPLNTGAQAGLLSTINGDYLNPANNPGFQQTLDDLTNKYARGTAASRDASAAMSRNFGGSAYQEMKGVDNRAFADSLNKTAGDMYGVERNNQMQAYGMAPTLAGEDYKDAQALLGVGDAIRNETQGVNDLNYANWLEAQNHPYQQLNTLQSAITGSVGNQGTATATGPNPNAVKTNNTAQILGTGAQVASMAMKSDIRTKENIIPTGFENGFQTYAFNYIDEPERYIGVMAQEVEISHPQAVIEINGVKHVHYDMIGVQMRRIN